MSLHRVGHAFCGLWVAGLALGFATIPAIAAEVRVETADGFALGLDSATGAVTRVEIDGSNWADVQVAGGFFVRDQQRLAEVPTGAALLLPNPSFEQDNPADGMPDYWQFNDGWLRGATLLYGNDAFDGARGVTIQQFAGGQVYSPDVAVAGGQRYALQCMFKGTSSISSYVVWKTDTGDFLLYEGGRYQPASANWRVLVDVFEAPAGAALADVGFVSSSDGDLTLDLARMYAAPAQAWTAIPAQVSAVPGGAVATASLPALGLEFRADLLARSDRIDIEASLRDTSGQDRALDAGLVLPVLVRSFWDHARGSRQVSQKDYSETFSYTWWGRIYNDGRLGQDRSIYPFQAVGLGGAGGVAMAYDIERGPQDLRFYHSTYVGDSFTARVRLGLAPEPSGFSREGRFRLSVYRVDGQDGFRSALDRYYRAWPQSFTNRLPGLGGWTPWVRPSEVPAINDFGIDVHSYDDDVLGDDALGVVTLGYLPSWDYWLPLGDFSREPTAAEARARLDFNATQSGVDPQLQEDARSIKVSGIHDASGGQVLEIYQRSWMPGSGWSAVCGVDPDPEVRDRSGNGWASRFDLFRSDLDARFVRAQGSGAVLDGAFFDWFRSSFEDAYDHRRSNFESCDVSPSWDPATLTPALFEPMAHWDATRAIAQDMRGRGLFTMARSVHFPSFWATALLDTMADETDWSGGEDDDDVLSYYRAIAGRKPYSLLFDGDLDAFDHGHALRRLLLYGLLAVPYWDSRGGDYYFRQPALYERDRALYRKFTALHRFQQSAGWEPLTHATSSDPAVRIERWGRGGAEGLWLSAWNSAAVAAPTRITVDLAALGIAPTSLGRVVDLIEAGVRPATTVGTSVAIDDQLEPDAARLYHLHVASAATALRLLAVKRGGDVALSWTDAGRPGYELLRGVEPDLGGALVELVTVPAASDPGLLGTPGLRFYLVE